jgi:hypothetical protein
MIDLAGRRSNIRGVNCKKMAVSSTVLLPILKAEVAKVIDERKKYILNMTVRRKGIEGVEVKYSTSEILKITVARAF